MSTPIVESIDSFLYTKNSPLQTNGAFFWVLGRWHGFDGRLTVAIGWAETQLATDPNMSKADLAGYNCWGYGHAPGKDHGYLFPSWPDGISSVSDWLMTAYISQGLDTVAKICPKWVGNYSQVWVDNVSTVMTQLGANPNKLTRVSLARHR